MPDNLKALNMISRILATVSLCSCAGLAQAEDDPAGFWGNTLSAATGLAGAPAWHPGSILLALLAVVGLMAALAWLLRRSGWLPGAGSTGAGEPKILFYARFNASQTLLLLEAEKGLRLVVLRGRRVEFLADLPGHPPQAGAGRKTFQTAWLQCLQAAKRPRA